MKLLRGLAVALVVTFALGAMAVGCGPQEKFCVDASDYVCVPLVEASAPVDAADAGDDSGLDGSPSSNGGDSSISD
jgi:hypothetical protein